MLSKESALARLRASTLRFSCYETSELRVRVYGDAAVVTGQLDRRSSTGKTDHWRFTKVYTRRADAWVVAAMHASAIAEGSHRALAERCGS